MEERAGERFPRRNSRIEPLNLLKSDIANLPKRGNRFSLSAFCGVGGAKWGEGRGEVFRSTIFGFMERRLVRLLREDSEMQPASNLDGL
jgi:hypothetical protein